MSGTEEAAVVEGQEGVQAPEKRDAPHAAEDEPAAKKAKVDDVADDAIGSPEAAAAEPSAAGEEGAAGPAEAAAEAAVPVEPQTIGYRTFNTGLECYKYFHGLITKLRKYQNLNQVCARALGACRPSPERTVAPLPPLPGYGPLPSHRHLPLSPSLQYEHHMVLDLITKGHPEAERKVGDFSLSAHTAPTLPHPTPLHCAAAGHSHPSTQSLMPSLLPALPSPPPLRLPAAERRRGGDPGPGH